MSKARFIELAKQAGWEYADDDRGFEPLWAFGELVRADEREACMKEADKLRNRFTHLLRPPIVVAVGCFLLAYIVGYS